MSAVTYWPGKLHDAFGITDALSILTLDGLTPFGVSVYSSVCVRVFGLRVSSAVRQFVRGTSF